MKKPERIDNALSELAQIYGTIELIQHDIDQLEWNDELTDDEKTAQEKELEKDLRKQHGNLAYWANRFLRLMRNNEKYFTESVRL